MDLHVGNLEVGGSGAFQRPQNDGRSREVRTLRRVRHKTLGWLCVLSNLM